MTETTTEESAAARVARAERLLERGEPILAYDAAQTGLQANPGHVRLRQLQALALARSGDDERANALLRTLVEEGHEGAETLGLLARTHKDLAQRAPDAATRTHHLSCARGLYSIGLLRERPGAPARISGGNDRRSAGEAWYVGINAAAMSVLLGELGNARAIAREVREICANAGESDYWREATLGEAALILGEADVARAHYAAAARLAGGRYADVGSTRRQAELLLAHLPAIKLDVRAVLATPPVLVFSGHMIDGPERATPRFPASFEGAVRDALRARIAALAPLAAYGSAACGVDLLCLELARDAGAETHVVLPFPADEFRRASVDFAGEGWTRRFERALESADSVTITSDHRASGSAATFEYANLVLTGLGCLRAQRLETSVRALVVWDRSAAGAGGGAASQVALWSQRGLEVDSVDLAALRGAPTRGAVDPPLPELTSPRAGHALRSMLFADVVGYSRLNEDQIPCFVSAFLGAVAALNRETAHRPEHTETAGDGLYFVFRDAGDAAHYALQLSALVRGTDWGARGLPPQFNLRMALHCGPVHCFDDPLTGRPLYTGPHTNRAARIEPITPPGLVYASQAFAAVAAAQGVSGIDLRYVGTVALAKGYGSLPLYHVCPPTR